MITLSLTLNLLVLVPVCGAMVGDTEWASRAYGPYSPARGVLLAVYLTIAVTSFALLLRPTVVFAVVLLTLQVIYKVLSPFTVGQIRHPVVVVNLLIAAVHSVTLVTVLGGGG